MKSIKLNDNTEIDLGVLLDTKLLIQANSGGGKSWAIRRLLEQSHGQVQQIVIDLEGEFGTLREKYDYILAGKGGDTPADPRSADLLAKRLLELNVSAIIDLYELGHFNRKFFVKKFLDALVNAPKSLWHPVIIVIDEAHVFCPEKGQSEAAGSVIDLATRGRKRGYCAVLATQRLSKLNKDAAAECNNKLIGRTGLDVDMKRASEELGFTSKEQYLSLRSLDAGEFFTFGPAISNEVKKVKIGPVETTHPKAGSRILTAAPIPPTAKIREALGKLGDLPKEAQEEAKTTEELKQQVRELTRQLRLQPKTEAKTDQRELDEIRRDAEKQVKSHQIAFSSVELGYKNTIQQWENYAKDLLRLIYDFRQKTDIDELNKKMPSKEPGLSYKKLPITIGLRKVMSVPQPGIDAIVEKMPKRISNHAVSIGAFEDNTKLGPGEKKILIAAGQYEEGITREHLTVLTGYKRSSRNTYIQRLSSQGLVETDGEKVYITPQGISNLGTDYEPLPAGEELRKHVLQTLPEGERRILNILLENYPDSIDRETLSETTNYQRSSRNTYLQRLKARALIDVIGSSVKASDKLFA